MRRVRRCGSVASRASYHTSGRLECEMLVYAVTSSVHGRGLRTAQRQCGHGAVAASLQRGRGADAAVRDSYR